MVELKAVLPDFSVVVCSYTEDRLVDLLNAVESIRNQSLPPLEIIVVIDHNPALFTHASKLLRDVHVVENCESRGLAGARNSGIAASRGSLIAFMDEDAMAARDWLESLAVCYSEPGVLGAGGLVEPVWVERRPDWFPVEFDWVVGCTYKGMPQAIQPVRNLIGCNMSFRREILEAVGGFRIGRVGSLSIGQENDETELCIRASIAFQSSKILFQPAARVFHKVHAGRGRLPYFVRRCYSEGISKIRITRLFGGARGLATERSYILRTLPMGILNCMRLFIRGDLRAAGRACAIVLGFGVTLGGYITGLFFVGQTPNAAIRGIGVQQNTPVTGGVDGGVRDQAGL